MTISWAVFSVYLFNTYYESEHITSEFPGLSVVNNEYTKAYHMEGVRELIEGTFTWQLEEDIYLIGSINADDVLTRVAIYSEHSIPEEAAESSRIIVSAVYALIYS